MIRYDLATLADDAAIRALLRDNAMPSWVSMAATREPSFFAGVDRYGRDWAVLARQGQEVVGMYTCSEQAVHLNGAATELAYLGGLRVVPRYRHRLSVLRQGYASLERLSPGGRRGLCYTAIACDNLPARRILEAGLRDMPRYRPLNDFVTLALPKSRGRRLGLWRPARLDDADEMAALCRCYNQQAARYQFSPVLTPERAAQTGAQFYLLDTNLGQAQAVMALWPQQAYKQVRAQAYRPPLGWLLPLYNAYARLMRRIPLPAVGQPLDQTYLAFFALAPESGPAPLNLTEVLADALALCPTAVLTLGLHADHPWLKRLEAVFRPARYRTRIYAVDFPSSGLDSPQLDSRPAQPEVALL